MSWKKKKKGGGVETTGKVASLAYLLVSSAEGERRELFALQVIRTNSGEADRAHVLAKLDERELYCSPVKREEVRRARQSFFFMAMAHSALSLLNCS